MIIYIMERTSKRTSVRKIVQSSDSPRDLIALPYNTLFYYRKDATYIAKYDALNRTKVALNLTNNI